MVIIFSFSACLPFPWLCTYIKSNGRGYTFQSRDVGPDRVRDCTHRKFPLDFSPCSARHVTHTILRRCCAPCVVAVTSSVHLSMSSCLLTFSQAVRRYASAAPTAAFAGQKGSNVRLCISASPSTNSGLTLLLG
jgi:hypothetical protein